MENELMKLWQVPRSSWLVSGQDEPARAALLQAELTRRRGLRVIVAAEETVPAAVQAARRAGFKRLRTLPAAGEGYFPAFTPDRATERESRLLELLRVQGLGGGRGRKGQRLPRLHPRAGRDGTPRSAPAGYEAPAEVPGRLRGGACPVEAGPR